MNDAQIALLRRIVAQANSADMDVGISTNILAALLDEHDAHKDLVAICTGIIECLDQGDLWKKPARRHAADLLRTTLAKIDHKVPR